MSTTLTATIKLSLTWKQQLTNTGGPTTSNNGSWNPGLSYANGGQVAGDANEFYEAIRTLTASSSETLDLTSGLTNLVNVAVVFTTIRTCLVWLMGASRTGPDNTTTGTAASYITVGNAATNQALTAAAPNGFFGSATCTFNVPNDGFCCFGVATALGFTVDSTHKSLKIANGDAGMSAKYVLALVGTNS